MDSSNNQQSQEWIENNQKYLIASINQIRNILKKYILKTHGDHRDPLNENKDTRYNTTTALISEEIINFPQWTEKYPPAIESLCLSFGLSQFEKNILLLCTAVEIDSEIAHLCSKIQGNSMINYPTFGLALEVLPRSHWNALTPVSPLRQFRLIDLSSNTIPPPSLIATPIRIEERILHYIVGISYLDRQFHGIIKPVEIIDVPVLVRSHHEIIKRIILHMSRNTKEKINRPFPLIQLYGIDETSKLNISKLVCAELGLGLWQLPVELIPSKYDEIQSFIQLLNRELALLGCGLYLCGEDMQESILQKSISRLIDEIIIPVPIFLGTRERWPFFTLNRTALSLEIQKPKKSEQLETWISCLGKDYNKVSHKLPKIVGQFDLNTSSIQTIVNEAVLYIKMNNNKDQINVCGSKDEDENEELFNALWESSRTISRQRLVTDLAEQITPRARIKDVILPPKEKQLLYEIIIHALQRYKVYEEWGLGDRNSSRGLGITILFSGGSGTGKTMAAEALANELHLDIFRIDLSMVISKYIGETEKNLRRVFDAAEDGGAILFFDEADSLFGKRSEIHDSHDRYANIEVGYLLQRIETYRGLVILATNMKDSLDTSFLRRIRFGLNFPFPDIDSRVKIWQHMFTPNTPTEGLDFQRLAKINIAGGNIHNIVLYASFLAANEGTPVKMNHIKRAAEVEYIKLERPLTQAEFGDL